MVLKLENSRAAAIIHTLGAELKSFRTAKDNLEFLWQGGSGLYPRTSPLVFPIIGPLKNDRYTHAGSEYEMEHHGFAQNLEFALIGSTPDTASMKLSYDDATLKKYPFKFELSARFVLNGNLLSITRTVRNLDDKPMYFSIGEHPGFNWPLCPGEKIEDYRLVFEKMENINRLLHDAGVLNGNTMPFLDNQNEVRLSGRTFEKRAIVLNGLNSGSVSLVSQVSQTRATVTFNGFPTLVIWSAIEGAPFVCIEPWYGSMPTRDWNMELKNRNQINTLRPGGVFECSYSIQIRQ